MELTRKQEEGLKIAIQRHQLGEKYTVISGYAGTGKSTLVKFIIEALGVEKSHVCYATFTGKAAEVLRKKGNENACTLHRLLYDSIPRPAGGYFRKPKPNIPYDIVVVDEISMVPLSILKQLFKHPCYVICLGDPFQLPPVDENKENKDINNLLDHPHIFLDQIMRQAADSEIIRLSMDIREMKPLEYIDGQNVKMYDGRALENKTILTWADQVLVGTNKKRFEYNAEIRSLLGKGPLPEDGDKVICLHNYWEDFSLKGDPLVNGTIGYLRNPMEGQIDLPLWIKHNPHYFEILDASVETEDGFYPNVSIDKKMLIKEERCCDWRTQYALMKNKYRIGDLMPRDFAYGYAITTHKSQGSEWDKVVVIEEKFPYDKIEHARWLYTSVTRASQKLVLIRS